MALHRHIQNLLLVGVRHAELPLPRRVEPPARLMALVEALKPAHRAANERAVAAGHRYRSAFWLLYLLSALAVLLGVMPAVLGWDAHDHPLHPWGWIWSMAELLVIASVAATYVLGHRRDWQGQWLAARTEAELVWYLPLAAMLHEDGESAPDHWYGQRLQVGAEDPAGDVMAGLCRRFDAAARAAMDGAWQDAAFSQAAAQWMASIAAGQCYYHAHVARHNEALQHRVHQLTALLFVLTALASAAHLVWHAAWLLLPSVLCPALGAALHGALAQSEAFRLQMSAERLEEQLGEIGHQIEAAPHDAAHLRQRGNEMLDLILAEHQDWHMLVKPHHLPLG